MKLAVVGGSAPSTPHLFRCDEMRDAASDIEVELLGRSRQNLQAVSRAIREVGGSSGEQPHLASLEPAPMRDALRGAAVVLVQVRCGGYAGRIFDETFPLRYGICGDEGLGPGGLSAAWRSWPSLTDIFDAIRDACPSSVVLLLTSPVSVLVRCVRSAYPDLDVLGICELPWTTLSQMCAAVGADPLGVSFAFAGVNHLGWFSDVNTGSRSLVDEFRATRTAADGFPSAQLIESAGGVPLKYLRLHYETDAVAREQMHAREPRGAELEAIQAEALETFARGDRNDIEAALASRPAPWYEHAVGPLIASIARPAASTRIPLFLSVPNRGRLHGFDDDDIVEIPHRVEDGRLFPIPDSCAVPRASAHDLQAFVRYERAASQAVLRRSVDAMSAALAIHPWVRSDATARLLAEDIETSAAAVQPATAAASLR